MRSDRAPVGTDNEEDQQVGGAIVRRKVRKYPDDRLEVGAS